MASVMADGQNRIENPGGPPPGVPPASGGGGRFRRGLVAVTALLAVSVVVLAVSGAFSSPSSGPSGPAQPPTRASSGSSATTTTTLKNFDAQQASICADARQQSAAIGPPTQGPALAKWATKALAISTQVFQRFSALSPPANLASPFRRYLAGLQIGLTQMRAMAAAAQAGNFTLFVQLVSEPTPAAESADEKIASHDGIGCVQPAATAPAQPSADAAAKELAHTAQVAIETYATDHNGSYANATADTLHRYESLIQVGPGKDNAYIPVDGVKVLDGGKGYVVTADATSGDTFSIERGAGGNIFRSCTAAGAHSSSGCPASETW
jgi:hypothetical protein